MRGGSDFEYIVLRILILEQVRATRNSRMHEESQHTEKCANSKSSHITLKDNQMQELNLCLSRMNHGQDRMFLIKHQNLITSCFHHTIDITSVNQVRFI